MRNWASKATPIELKSPGRGPMRNSRLPMEEGEAATRPAVKIEQAGGGQISVVSA